ncbi:MATE family efflux transporter [Nocardioidaceae bacterium]|nr:MATE family efflux transporter [Nocardioidaceae bacterium]
MRERRWWTSRDRQIAALAGPAFLALIAEPLFLLADAAIVGRLGTTPLAGLGLAAAVLQTVVGVCVFLAYGTTAAVARRLGADDRRGALAVGIDGIWLAVVVGVLVTVPGMVLAGPLVGLFGASEEATAQAVAYLVPALLGVTPLLVILAATGVLRGFLDTRTPLLVAVVTNLLNVVLNVVLVFGLDLGIAGSAYGSVIAQTLGAVWLLTVVVRGALREEASLRPDVRGIRLAARAGTPLVVRTLTLRAALLLTTYAVALGPAGPDQDVDLATHQLALTLWSTLAFALDAIAIAGQALTGRSLGASDVTTTRADTRRMIQWGLAAGFLTGAGLAALSPVLGALFTPETAVQERLVPVLLLAALAQPVAGVVFVLDGVLIGAGDGPYLAWGGLLTLLVYAPLALLAGAGPGLVAVWAAFALVFMGARAVVLVHRERGDRWLVTGA